MIDPSDGPLIPQSPLEKFIQKLTLSMQGYTSLVREVVKLVRNLERKTDALLQLASNSQGSGQISSERLNYILEIDRASRTELIEVRRLLTELHSKVLDQGYTLKQVKDEVTGEHDLPTRAELEGPPSGLHKGGINLTWRMIGRGAGRLWPLFAGVGIALASTIWHWVKSHG